jgi:hypothetical protein
MQTTPRKPSSCLDFKTKGKNPPKQESLVFLETTVHRVGETAENQRKTREKSKVAENQVFWLDFCAKKKELCIPSLFISKECGLGTHKPSSQESGDLGSFFIRRLRTFNSDLKFLIKNIILTYTDWSF